MSNHPHSVFDRVFLTTVAVVLGLLGAVLGAVTSDAHGVTSDDGWLRAGRVIENPRGVLVEARIPHCGNEDGSGRITPRCKWIGWQDGNGRGLSLWYDGHNRRHYVWPSSPANHGWVWVSSSLADALAEGGSLHADTRRWERCVVNVGPTTIVRCADGHREVS